MKKLDEKLLSSNPFIFNESDRIIACVGENGGTDDEDILQGFKSTVLLIVNNIINEHGTEDELIYPLVYSVRHCVELALKISIEKIKTICDIKELQFELLPKELHTHDIQSLEKSLKKISSVDRRIDDWFSVALQYTKDYHFDKKSDIFRYAKDREGNESLAMLDISQISIETLKCKFDRMMELLENAILELDFLIKEYSVGTYTQRLSRFDIEQISLKLPDYDLWGNEEFASIKEKLKSEYQIGSNALSDGIDIIKNHPLFAANIKIEIQVGCISCDEMQDYCELVVQLYNPEEMKPICKQAGENIEILLKELPKKMDRQRELAKNISNEALCSILAFGDMVETGDVFCENYAKHYSYFTDNKSLNRDWIIKKIRTVLFAKKVSLGLRLCGQKQYEKMLECALNNIAEI